MSARSIGLSDALQQYVVAHSATADPILAELADETRALGDVAGMQIAPEQGVFLTLMARVVGARHAVEVGTFTGYSSLCIARGMSEGGHLLCCDVSEEWTSVARRYWERAGVAQRIELRLAPGLETLRSLPEEQYLDLAFIDADKTGYLGYWEEIVPRMRAGGVVLVDNVFQDGDVVDDPDASASVSAVVAFNDHVAADARVTVAMLPLADGVTMAVREGAD